HPGLRPSASQGRLRRRRRLNQALAGVRKAPPIAHSTFAVDRSAPAVDGVTSANGDVTSTEGGVTRAEGDRQRAIDGNAVGQPPPLGQPRWFSTGSQSR